LKPVKPSSQLIDEVNQTSGMIPLSIDSKKSIITWRDFGQYHTYEGRFSQATKAQFGITEKILGKAPNECQTPLSLLNQANFDGVPRL